MVTRKFFSDTNYLQNKWKGVNLEAFISITHSVKVLFSRDVCHGRAETDV